MPLNAGTGESFDQCLINLAGIPKLSFEIGTSKKISSM